MGAIIAAALVALAPPLTAVAQSRSDAGIVTVEARSMKPTLEAYAQVEPISLLTVTAPAAGILAGLRVVPGMHVRAGQELAHLSGPQIDAMLSQARYSVATAQTQLATAEKVLATQRQQFEAQLTTRDLVNQAEGAAAEAKTALNAAQSRLSAALQTTAMVAPSESIVLALNSTDGALVSTGQAILTLQPANRLQLTATYYGPDIAEVHAGMTGTFVPSDGNAPVPVKVSAIVGAVTAGGGASVAMVAGTGSRAAPRWMTGEFGRVTLDLPRRTMVAVPTRALVLDQGKWWVMVHTAKGNHAQAVVPGPAEGWDTFIEQGLQPGAQVVVENAYLLFHQGITQTFQIPD